jgi:NTE family protein
LKEIAYSSRTRATTDQFKTVQRLRNRISELLQTLPDECRCSEAYRALERVADRRIFKIVHLIYQSRSFEAVTKDFEFSRLSMEEHWRAGRDDAARTLAHPEALEAPGDGFSEGVETFDVLVDGRR